MKYTNSQIVFREFPDEITLAYDISNCKIHCPKCHSPWLWDNVGDELTIDVISKDINDGITCIGLLGGDVEDVTNLAKEIKEKYPNIKVGWYTGTTHFPNNLSYFDYVKVGPYKYKLGGLDNPKTNQRMYEVIHDKPLPLWGLMKDITYKFWNVNSNKE